MPLETTRPLSAVFNLRTSDQQVQTCSTWQTLKVLIILAHLTTDLNAVMFYY